MEYDTKKKLVGAAIGAATLLVSCSIGYLIGTIGKYIKDRIL